MWTEIAVGTVIRKREKSIVSVPWQTLQTLILYTSIKDTNVLIAMLRLFILTDSWKAECLQWIPVLPVTRQKKYQQNAAPAILTLSAISGRLQIWEDWQRMRIRD